MTKNISKKTINLYVENESGGEDIIPKIVKRIKLGQIEDSLKIVLDIAQVLDGEPALRELFKQIFAPKKDEVDMKALGEMTDEQLDELAAAKKREKDMFMFNAAYQSMKTLLTYLPTQGLQLISAMTKIDLDILREQELEVGFEILDAIFELNDMEMIIERGKQSFAIASSTMAFLNKKEK